MFIISKLISSIIQGHWIMLWQDVLKGILLSTTFVVLCKLIAIRFGLSKFPCILINLPETLSMRFSAIQISYIHLRAQLRHVLVTLSEIVFAYRVKLTISQGHDCVSMCLRQAKHYLFAKAITLCYLHKPCSGDWNSHIWWKPSLTFLIPRKTVNKYIHRHAQISDFDDVLLRIDVVLTQHLHQLCQVVVGNIGKQWIVLHVVMYEEECHICTELWRELSNH
mmetsp:Transcript_78128/g.135503  ORF Transcript_78128/g.135503 Transcript_78128/m.135503 type:complete len:222 (+) Transcript_78128:49-714(+)